MAGPEVLTTVHELDSIQRARSYAKYQCVRKNMSPHLKALDPIPRGCWFGCGLDVGPVATTSVDTLLGGRDRTSPNG